MQVLLQAGDSLELLKTLPANSVDSIVTDPPYGLEFMGKEWDTFKKSPGKWTGMISPEDRGEEDVFTKKGFGTLPEFRSLKPEAKTAFQAWCTEWAVECLRVAKPGAHMLAFGGTRMFHRLACAIEDAGWEIRDCASWVYGSGFPKSLNVASAIDKAARGTPQGSTKGDPEKRGQGGLPERTALAMGGRDGGAVSGLTDTYGAFEPQTEAAKQWNGWGTALKPAWEPIIVARKPLAQNVAKNVQEYGTGALNIDACRIAGEPVPINKLEAWSGFGEHKQPDYTQEVNVKGRWPANFLWTHHPECVRVGSEVVRGKQLAAGCTGFGVDREDNYELGTGAEHAPDELVESWDCHPECPSQFFPDTGKSAGGGMKDLSRGDLFMGATQPNVTDACGFGDTGSAARFFYCAKVSRREREAGCENLPAHTTETTVNRDPDSAGARSPRAGASRGAGAPRLRCTKCGADGGGGRFVSVCTDGELHTWVEIGRGAAVHNDHPTVKPIQLMRHLCKLVTPPNGIILDPFMGSGTTGCAAVLEHFRFIGFDLSPHHVDIAKARIAYWRSHEQEFDAPVKKRLDKPTGPALDLD